MVLFDQVIKVLDVPQFTAFRKEFSGFELGNGFRIDRVFIGSDHTRSRSGGVGLKRNSSVFPCESTARYRYIQAVAEAVPSACYKVT